LTTFFHLNPQLVSRFSRGTESWKEVARRVSSLSRDDSEGVRELIGIGALVPAGQILRGAGDNNAVLYNSYALGPKPGETIVEVAAKVSAWTARGIGVGVNLSELVAAPGGPNLLEAVKCLGKSQHLLWEKGIRRTATMVVLNLQVPDIAGVAREISIDPTLRHLNMAVLLGDDAMTELESDSPASEDNPIFPLISAAWACGNPGFVFIDRVNRDRIFDKQLTTCNACAEQFLEPDEGVPLASLNLAAFTGPGGFDFECIEQTTRLAVRFLDDIIDATAFPSARAESMARRRRRIGLGVMGLDTALRHLGVAYDSDEAVSLSAECANCMRNAADDESRVLAVTRGEFSENPKLLSAPRRRNAGLLSIAPTGGISSLWGVSSGIEPIFGERLEKESTLIHVDIGSKSLPLSPPGAIHWRWHLRHLAAWQSRVDGGISKTVALPAEVTVPEIRRMLIEAWTRNVKSVSIFRSNCRPPGVRSL
jgi:ribonucleoside-diphosphate reductase alpha chain